MPTIEVQLFGAFKELAGGKCLNFEFDGETSVAKVRSSLIEELEKRGCGAQEIAIVHESVFADEVAILSEESRLTGHKQLAIIPPVCGG